MEWLIIFPVGFILFWGFVALVLRLVLRGSQREAWRDDGWVPDHNGYACGGGSGGDCGGDSGGGDSSGGD